MGQHAANTRDLLEHLGIDRAAIVGHSFGGMLATRFALVYPDVLSREVGHNPHLEAPARFQAALVEFPDPYTKERR